MEDREWTENEFQKLRPFLELRHGGEDDDFKLAPVDLTTPFTIQGCPVALSQAYFTLYLDESITEEFIVDRFGKTSFCSSKRGGNST